MAKPKNEIGVDGPIPSPNLAYYFTASSIEDKKSIAQLASSIGWVCPSGEDPARVLRSRYSLTLLLQRVGWSIPNLRQIYTIRASDLNNEDDTPLLVETSRIEFMHLLHTLPHSKSSQ